MRGWSFVRMAVCVGCWTALFGTGFTGVVRGQDEEADAVTAAVEAIEASYDAAVSEAAEARIAALEDLVKQLTRERRFDEAEVAQARLDLYREASDEASPMPEIGHAAADDFLEALSDYRETTAAFDAELSALLEERIEEATESGNLAKVRMLQDLSERLAAYPFTPTGDEALDRAIERLASRMERQQVVLERARNTAINRMVVDGSVDDANAVMAAAMEALEGHSRWLVIFLGTDSSTWNTSSTAWNSWARPLSEVPSSIRFVRVRRLDTNDAIVLPMDPAKLGERYDQGTVGWGGDGYEHEGIIHIGVFRTDVKADQRGNVVVGRDGFTPHTGWGFGHRHNVRDAGAALVWNGQEIRLTALEISVCAGSLGTADRRALLIDPR